MTYSRSFVSSPVPFKLSLLRFNNGLEAGVILVQGVLAGLTLASLYMLSMSTDLEDFVAAYEVRAEHDHVLVTGH